VYSANAKSNYIMALDMKTSAIAWTTANLSYAQTGTLESICSSATSVYVAGITSFLGTADVFVVRLNASDGGILFDVLFGSNATDSVTSMVATDAMIYFAGYTGGSMFGPHSTYALDVFVGGIHPETGALKLPAQWSTGSNPSAIGLAADRSGAEGRLYAVWTSSENYVISSASLNTTTGDPLRALEQITAGSNQISNSPIALDGSMLFVCATSTGFTFGATNTDIIAVAYNVSVPGAVSSFV
jgi:hypothetical protein